MAILRLDSDTHLSPQAADGKPASLHDSARASPEPSQQPAKDGFHQLVDDINNILGPCNGIDSAGVDIGELKFVMRDYRACEAEWEPYAFADYSRAYTRNLVDRGNGKCNLVSLASSLSFHGLMRPLLTNTLQLLLVWTPGKGSPIHDHANAHCVMKILKGRLRETIYGWPCQRSDNPTPCSTHPSSLYPSTEHSCSGSGDLGPASLQVIRSTVYQPEQVTYMSDRLGLHRVENASDSEVAVSLHLYTVSRVKVFPSTSLFMLLISDSLQTRRSTAAMSSMSPPARRFT